MLFARLLMLSIYLINLTFIGRVLPSSNATLIHIVSMFQYERLWIGLATNRGRERIKRHVFSRFNKYGFHRRINLWIWRGRGKYTKWASVSCFAQLFLETLFTLVLLTKATISLQPLNKCIASAIEMHKFMLSLFQFLS